MWCGAGPGSCACPGRDLLPVAAPWWHSVWAWRARSRPLALSLSCCLCGWLGALSTAAHCVKAKSARGSETGGTGACCHCGVGVATALTVRTASARASFAMVCRSLYVLLLWSWYRRKAWAEERGGREPVGVFGGGGPKGEPDPVWKGLTCLLESCGRWFWCCDMGFLKWFFSNLLARPCGAASVSECVRAWCCHCCTLLCYLVCCCCCWCWCCCSCQDGVKDLLAVDVDSEVSSEESGGREPVGFCEGGEPNSESDPVPKKVRCLESWATWFCCCGRGFFFNLLAGLCGAVSEGADDGTAGSAITAGGSAPGSRRSVKS